jgi:hypothetical protein
MLQRLRSLNKYERWMFTSVLFAVLLRLALILFNWPFTNSDETSMGLLAFHVAYQGDHSSFFYGQSYMGPLEGYAAAPLFRLFGPSLFLLRLPLVFFSAFFLFAMYHLLCLLYQNQKFALAMIIFLGLGSPDTFFLQLRAIGGYPEVGMFAAFMCLFVVWLALSSGREKQARWKRPVLYALLGLIFGLALWVDLLMLPFVAVTGLFLCFFCWRELMKWPGLSLVLGFVVGSFPLIYYNVTAPWNQNSWFVLRQIQNSGAADLLADHMSWLNQLTGTLMVSLPRATDGGQNCPLSAIPPAGSPTPATLPCVLFQSGWSLGYLVLWFVAAFLAIYAIRQVYRHKHAGKGPVDMLETRQATIRQAGRLAVLVSVALTLLIYAPAPASALTPVNAFRYLTCLLLALPLLLWPVWQGLMTRRFSLKWGLSSAILLVVMVTLVAGTLRTLWQIPSAVSVYQQQEKTVQDLLAIHATRVYSDYWTCNNLTFLSQEKIICAVLDNNLHPGFDRYMPYRAIVRADPNPTYIFASDSPQARILQQQARLAPSRYRVYTFDRYLVYQMK